MRKDIKIKIYAAIAFAVYFSIIAAVTTPKDIQRILSGQTEAKLGIFSYNITSEFQKGSNRIKVLVPDKIDAGKKYTVLYILPPTLGIWDSWWNNGLIEAAKADVHNKYNVICVAPMFANQPWYADHPSNLKIRQESYMLQAVIPFIDQEFSTQADARGRMLLGFSKSGCGAYSLLLRHPDVFGRAAAWDAPMSFEELNVPGSNLIEIFGTKANFKKYHIPTLLIKQAQLLQQDPSRLVLMGYGYAKDHTETIHNLMIKLGIPHIYDNSTERRHRWDSGWLPQAVEYLFQLKY